MTDKRYNRWKRRKRKSKEPRPARSPSPSGSSCDETVDENQPHGNIRRKKRLNKSAAMSSGHVPYDASSERTSSDINNVSLTEHAHSDDNERKSGTEECRFEKPPTSNSELLSMHYHGIGSTCIVLFSV